MHRFEVSVSADALQFALLQFAAVNYCSPLPCATLCRLGQFPLLSNKSASAHHEPAVHPNSIPVIAGFG